MQKYDSIDEISATIDTGQASAGQLFCGDEWRFSVLAVCKLSQLKIPFIRAYPSIHAVFKDFIDAGSGTNS